MEPKHKTIGNPEPALYSDRALYTTNLGRAWRMAAGADMTEKMQSLMTVLPDALGRIIPSFHPLDLLVGLCFGAGLRLAVYLKGKNAQEVPPWQRIWFGPLGQCQGH